MSIAKTCLAVFAFSLLGINAIYGQNKATASGNPAGGSTSLSGVTFFKETWNDQITAPPEPKSKHTRILCYSLYMTNGATLYNLQPTASINYSNGDAVKCSPITDKNPLMMDTLLVVAIDARNTDTSRLKLFNINVTSQTSSPLSPNPIRPSFGAGTASSNLGEAIYFLAWPIKLQGDTTATVNINAVFTPPVAGQAWKRLTLYPPGSIVVRSANPDGHYYITYNGGLSGDPEPAWKPTPAITDNNCNWLSTGATAPTTGGAKVTYALESKYNPLDVVYVPSNGQYYVQNLSASCTSGKSIPPFTTVAGITEENLPAADGKTTDGDLQLLDLQTYNTGCGKTGGVPRQNATHYKKNAVICNPSEKGREYKVLVSPAATSKTGDTPPTFVHLGEHLYKINPVSWTDLGPILPSGVSTALSTDQTLSLLNQPLPQTHSLYYYNVSSGVFVTTIRVPTFAFAAGSTTTTNSGKPIQTGSNLLIDPVISLTRYLKPFDAERRWQPSDLIPGLTLSFSLSSPTSNFYIGGSSEFQRYLQINYGFAIAKTPRLASQAFNPSTATSPTTTQAFSKGAYVGISFNISGLVQGLTGGSGGAKSSSASGQ